MNSKCSLYFSVCKVWIGCCIECAFSAAPVRSLLVRLLHAWLSNLSPIDCAHSSLLHHRTMHIDQLDGWMCKLLWFKHAVLLFWIAKLLVLHSNVLANPDCMLGFSPWVHGQQSLALFLPGSPKCILHIMSALFITQQLPQSLPQKRRCTLVPSISSYFFLQCIPDEATSNTWPPHSAWSSFHGVTLLALTRPLCGLRCSLNRRGALSPGWRPSLRWAALSLTTAPYRISQSLHQLLRCPTSILPAPTPNIRLTSEARPPPVAARPHPSLLARNASTALAHHRPHPQRPLTPGLRKGTTSLFQLEVEGRGTVAG
jgi:hypothetical protein